MADEGAKSENSLRKGVKVAVIGAGISGLAAASSLVQEGFDVILVEASDYIGGRLKQARPFPGFPPVDLGGGFIHGSNTITHNLAKENGWKVKKSHGFSEGHPNTQSIFINGKLYSWPHDTTQPDISDAHKAWQIITGLENDSTDKDQCSEENHVADSVNEQLNKHCKTAHAKEILSVVFGISHAAGLSRYGIAELKEKLKNYKSWGTGNHRLEGSYSVLISYYLEKCTKVDKRLNWPVKEIKWIADKESIQSQSPGVVITSEHGGSLTVDYAVVTVPLTILKDGDIIFSPPLPPIKQHAINTIHMGAALKIVCRFKTPFWKEKTVIFSVKGFLSQIWTYSRDPKEDGEECHVAVGFETAVRAAQKVHLSDEEVCEKFLQQLDELFGTNEDPNIASNNFMNFAYQHWSRHPYVRGGYSTPTANAHGLREQLAEPVGGRLFFAGEATAESATVQSAIETGMRAARQVCEAAR